MRYVLMLSAVFIIAGCSLHKPMMDKSSIDMPAAYSTGVHSPAPRTGSWWEQFEDGTLSSLMEKAFVSNFDIVQSFERLQQSRALLRIADSSRGLHVNIDGSAGRSRQPGVPNVITRDSFQLSSAASYEIDVWGRLSAASRAARRELLASEQDLRAMYVSISAQLADLYFLAVEQRAQMELSDRTISSFQDTLSMVERRYRSGLVPAIDVYQSRQNLASARAQRPVFASNLAVALNALSVLTGRFADGSTDVTAHELKDPPQFEVGIPSQLLSRRPDLMAALERLRARDQRIAAAVADRFPSFNLTGSYGGASEKLRTVLDSPNILWNVLLQAVQPVLDAGRRAGEVDRARAAFLEQLAAYHKTVLTAFSEVEDALARMQAAEERISMLRETVFASDSSLRLAIDRYMQGLSDYLPVLTEQLRNFSARSSLLTAQRQLISDHIQLARATGGDWMDELISERLAMGRDRALEEPLCRK